MTRIMAFSDFHARAGLVPALLSAAKDADLVIGAGDFCNMRQGLTEAMALLDPLAEKAVVVCGNAESAVELTAATRATVLHGTGTRRVGLALFGMGCAVPPTPFGDWSCDLTEAEAAALLAPMGSVDILITHAPPKGVADASSSGRSLGSTAILAAIERLQPRFCLCGHIHDSWGRRGHVGATEVINLGPEPVLLEL
ncbi:metallophosphoesterase family protein [Tabrizicola sp.]|uniref:metallophosphoesterase family protein n=1 Tax=Tabrizicola sp. TaxID=2005166 RepID=UPI003F40C900